MGKIFITPENALRKKARGGNKKKKKKTGEVATYDVEPKRKGPRLKPESELSKRQLRRRRAAEQERLRMEGKTYKGSNGLAVIDDGSLFGKKLKKMKKEDDKRAKRLRRRLSSLKSVFKKEVPQIQQFLLNNDNDNAIGQVQRHLVIMLVELITIAEDKYRELGNERQAYALNSLVSQLREVIADIRSEEDLSNLVTRIVNDALHPAFMGIGQNIVENVYHLRKELEVYVKPEDMKVVNERVNTMAKGIAGYMEESYKDISNKVGNIFEQTTGKKT